MIVFELFVKTCFFIKFCDFWVLGNLIRKKRRKKHIEIVPPAALFLNIATASNFKPGRTGDPTEEVLK